MSDGEHDVFSDEDEVDAPAPRPTASHDSDDEDEEDGYDKLADDLQKDLVEGAENPNGGKKANVEAQDNDDDDEGSERDTRRDGGDEVEDEEDEEEEEGVGEDEEEEEEEDEEEDDLPRAKKRRRKVNRFIDEEAMVDDDEEEEEDEEEGFVEGEEDFEELAKEAGDTRAHRELDSRREDAEEMDAEKIAETMKARYGRSEFNRGQYRGDVDHVPQSMLMPSTNDPKIWLCSCREGKERESVFAIMNRVFERENTANALDIYSVFARESLKGYIYIEARQQGVVQNALDGLNNIYLSKLRLVPVDEMVDCLTIKVKENNLDKIHWFRAKKGKYAGDLGQVIQITENGETMLCRFVPRLDPARDGVKVPFGQKRKKNEPRPPAKLFNPADFKGEVRKERDYYIYNNEYFDREGYLEKTLKISSLDVVNVQPTLEEISLFSGGTSDKPDLTHMEGVNTAVAQDFQIGESVTIASGAMAGLYGSVASIHNDIVGVKPHIDVAHNLPAVVTVTVQELRKKFNPGDHVQVIKGIHKGETGLIVIIKDNIVTLVSDGTMKPVEVLSTYLRTTSDVGVVATRTSPYDVGDLVFLANDVGVVTKIEGEYLGVLSQFGVTTKVKANQIRNKRDSKNAVANDGRGHPISSGASVDVIDPERQDVKKSGTVLHIFRQFVFIKARESNEILVAKSQNVEGTGVKPTNSYGTGYNSNPYGGGGGMNAPRGGGFGGGGGGGRGRGRGRGFDPLIGQTVTIATGPYKGYVGIVKEVVDGNARIELHTTSRLVTVDRNKLLRPGETFVPQSNSFSNGANSNAYGSSYGNGRYDGMGSGMSGGKTPAYGSKTPMGNRTPFLGGRTPGPMDGGRTPAWDMSSRTPARDMDLGSRSTAWDAGSKTPAHDLTSGRGYAWDAGSRTPAHPSYTPMEGISTTSYAKPVTSTSVPTGGNYADSHTAPPVAAAPTPHEWPSTRLLVNLKSDPSQRAIITATQPSARTATIQLKSTSETQPNVSYDDLLPVRPTTKGDKVMVLIGETAGQTGSLVSAEEADAIVKLDRIKEIRIFTLDMIGVYEGV
ncbi:hypothetical protein DFJ77DRAFT_449169 [Powellomyces hirtus]|nr:hypothetical protein DFJ77DRAFT_449169 [Powellomyces hirtus]